MKNRIPKEKQVEIIEEIRNGNNKLREEYAMYFYPRVKKMVETLNIKEEYKEDLIQIGMEEVLKTIDNGNFLHCAPYNVFQTSILKAWASYLKSLLVFRSQKDGKIYDTLESYYVSYTGKRPTGWYTIQELNKNGVMAIPINLETEYDKDLEFDFIDDVIDKEYLFSYVKCLSEREQYVICSYYGIFGYKKKSDTEIGQEIGCTRQNVCLIVANCHKKLKAMMCDEADSFKIVPKK